MPDRSKDKVQIKIVTSCWAAAVILKKTSGDKGPSSWLFFLYCKVSCVFKILVREKNWHKIRYCRLHVE